MDEHFPGALALLQLDVDSRLADRGTDGDRAEELQLARDIILADGARMARLDHSRLQRVEAMLAFLLESSVVEGVRRPTPEQAAALGPDVALLQTRRTKLDEFNARWAARLASPEVP